MGKKMFYDTDSHEEYEWIPAITITRRREGDPDLWVSTHSLVDMLDKPLEFVDDCAYKAKHNNDAAKVEFEYEHTRLHMNEPATMLVMDYCGAPDSAKNSVQQLFDECKKHEDWCCMCVLFNDDWSYEEDKWPWRFPVKQWYPPDAGTKLRDFSSETGYRKSSDGFPIKSPNEPLTYDELEEWEMLRVAALKKQNKIDIAKMEDKYYAAACKPGQYINEFEAKQNPTEQEKEELGKKIKEAQAESKKLHKELTVLRTLYKCPVCWERNDKVLLKYGLCLDEALDSGEISDDFFANKENACSLAEKYYKQQPVPGTMEYYTAVLYPNKKEEQPNS